MTDEQRKVFKRMMKNALRMQHRFMAEPLLAKTRKGYMKSEGVETLQRIKESLKRTAAKKAAKKSL